MRRYVRPSLQSGAWRVDPGPCPVDDAPHTTCTSPDYQPIVIPQMPCRDAALLAEPTASPPPVEAATTPFTTATYRRKRPR
jgi:hypothetical protein